MKHFLVESLRHNSSTWLSARIFSKRREDPRLERTILSLLTPIGLGLSKSERKSIRLFLTTLRRLHVSNSPVFVVKWLKVQYVNFQQAVGGNPSLDLTPLGCRITRTRRGLPKVIPRRDRLHIIQGDSRYIQKWITLFGLYRELNIPGKPNLSTITSETTGNINTMMMDPKLFCQLFKIPKNFLLEATSFPIASAGASLSGKPAGSIEGVKAAIEAWNNAEYKDILFDWINFTGSSWIHALFSNVPFHTEKESYKKGTSALGRLGFKQEPAGKVRVFAMVDPITQWCLRPLHDQIFAVLKKIPMDGTFDQVGPLKRVDWSKTHHCYDLSSATDRIPVRFSERLMAELIGDYGAQVWRKLLVGRPYYNPQDGTWVTYNCGQPMGALTSWAFGLSLVHHWIVQSSAQRAGVSGLFQDYALLGDDIVIWDDHVAWHYREILREIGVEISLPKSLVSRTCLEFAKRFIVLGSDCSPISFSEWWTATHSLGAAREFLHHYPSLNTAYKWKRAMGLTRTGARSWGKISTTYSVLWNLDHTPSLWDFYSLSPKGARVIIPNDQMKGLCGAYLTKVRNSIKRCTLELNELAFGATNYGQDLLHTFYLHHLGLIDKIVFLRELEQDIEGLKLDPGNLEFLRLSLKQSRVYSHFFDEMREKDRVQLWTLASYRRVHRFGF